MTNSSSARSPGLRSGIPGNPQLHLSDAANDIPSMTLGKQLRFLETGEIQRNGPDRARAGADVRVIAATPRDLLSALALNKFREDLYCRLTAIRIKIAPLRHRRDDIPPLVEHYVRVLSELYRINPPRFTEEAIARLVAYDWPGNVRELRTVVEQMVRRAGSHVLTVEDIPRSH